MEKDRVLVKDVVFPVFQMREDFKQSRLIKYMADESVPASKRLNWLPYFTYFANSFSDINNYILPYKEPANEFEEQINSHAATDAEHNSLINKDMRNLQDKLKNFTFADCLEFLWNDNIKNSRLVAYEIANLAQMATNPLVRYCLIRVIEELGNTFFLVSHNCTAGSIESNYFGDVHLGYEPGSLHGCDPKIFESETLTAEEAETARYVMQKCYDLFFDMIEEMYDRAQENRFDFD